jgi:hypothetical protein
VGHIDLSPYAPFLGRWFRSSAPRALAEEGVQIGSATDGGPPPVIPLPSSASGSLFVGGASGNGKTTLVMLWLLALRELVRQLWPPARQPMQAILDPQNDFEPLLGAIADGQGGGELSRVTYLAPLVTPVPLGLAVLARRAPSLETWCLQLAYLVSRLSVMGGRAEHGAGPRMIDVLYHLFLAAFTTPEGNVGLCWDALGRPDGLLALGSICESPQASTFCQTTRLSDDLRSSVLARLRLAFMSPAIESSVTAPECVPLDEILSTPGALLMVALGHGAPPTARFFWLSFFGQLIVNYPMSRPGSFTAGPAVQLVIDEVAQAAPFIGQELTMAVQSGRTRSLAVVAIGQGLEPIRAADPVLLHALLSNTTQIVSRLSPPDAAEFARLSPIPMGLEGVSVRQHRDDMAAVLANTPAQHFHLFAPNRHVMFRAQRVEHAAWAAAGRRHEVAIAALKARYTLPGTTQRRATLDDLVPPVARRGRRPAATSTTQSGPISRPAPPSSVVPDFDGGESPPEQPLHPPTPDAAAPSRPAAPQPRSRWG